jgi:hypothetical protein
MNKCAMKEFGINCQLWNKLFLVVVFHFPLVKAAMNALPFSKSLKDYLIGIGHGTMVLTKRFHFFIFQLPKAEQRPLHTCQLRRG